MIRDATEDDAPAIAEIYNHYIRNTVITFEEVETTAEDIQNRIIKIKQAGYSWLVAIENETVIGYAYASRWRERSAYDHSVEASVYLSSDFTSKGWGTQLYAALFDALRQKSVHVVIGGIALPNKVSVALHEKFGMEKVAHFKEVGFKFGRWVDVGYWQIKLTD